MHHELVIHEGAASVDRVAGDFRPETRTFRLVRDVFKRGRLWVAGERIDLDVATAGRLIDSGDIEEP